MSEMNTFNPNALYFSELLSDDGSELVKLTEIEMLKIANTELRQKCSGLKLASRIIGIATAQGGNVNDADVIEGMAVFLKRLTSLRQMALSVLEVDRHTPDFSVVFNTVTNMMLDVVADEWKWSKITNANAQLSANVIKGLLESTIRIQPEKFDYISSETDLPMVRRLAVLNAIPRLYNLMNYFNYYQVDLGNMIGRLMRSTVDSAELCASTMFNKSQLSVMEAAIFERMYSLSVGLMCEVYKATAAEDVARLMDMSEFDRSILILQFEESGGMPYDHVIERQKSAMLKMIETADLILEIKH